MSDLYKKTICELSKLLAKKEISSLELTKSYLDRIKKLDPSINSYILRCEENAIKDAKRADKTIETGRDITQLTGVPIALKDIFITKDIETTCGSKILKGYIPPYNGTVVQKLIDAGSVLLGKLNMDEFAMGSSNEHSAFGAVKNPWNKNMVPGGSSGGSAAAVSAGLCAASLGTDTGGSIRLPASFCNIVGLKPTYGRVSRYGIIAFASSLDQVGPMTFTVEDCAIVLKTIAGHDPNDATSLNEPVPDYTKYLKKDIKGLKIGKPKEYFIEGIDPEIVTKIEQGIDDLKKLGAKIIDISLPHTKYAIPAYYIIAPAEASSNLARYDGIRYGHRSKKLSDITELFENSRTEGFGSEVTLRIIIGTYVLSSGYYDAYYLKAQKVRALIRDDFKDAFKKCDAIVAPVTPTPPFKLGENKADPLKMYLADIFTISVNLAGLPGISVPCGFTKKNLPIGMQLIGRPLDEGMLLHIGYAYEQANAWYKRRPEYE